MEKRAHWEMNVEVKEVVALPEVRGKITHRHALTFFLFCPGDVGLQHWPMILGETGYAVTDQYAHSYETTPPTRTLTLRASRHKTCASLNFLKVWF